MSYWDSSALVKLYGQELDSPEFRTLAAKASRVVTGSLELRLEHSKRRKGLEAVANQLA